MADTNECIYFAGFFDGEGCVAIYPKKYVASLTNTDVRPLQRAKDIWGGFISCQTPESRIGAIQTLWRWQIYGHSSRAFLEQIRPFCIIKAEQIDCYLNVLSSVPNGRGQRHIGNSRMMIADASRTLRMLKRGA